MPSLYEIPVERIKGVGEKRGKLFRKLGVTSVGELLRFYPRGYEDWSQPVTIKECAAGDTCCIRAVVSCPVTERCIAGGRLLSRVRISDDTDGMAITFFNNQYIKNMLRSNEEYLFYGRITLGSGRKEMVSPMFMLPSRGKQIHPIYSQTAGITSHQIENAVKLAVDMLPTNIKDPIPAPILEKYNLCTLEFAIKSIHFPSVMDDVAVARRRLIFEELLVLCLGLSLLKKGRKKETSLKLNRDYTQEFFSLLPFTPTLAQLNAVKDCITDMSDEKSPMSRLVQGDVGCGKTAVAAAVCYSAVKNGWQAAFMAPTEILAEQHYSSLTKILANTNVRVALLTGSLTAVQKRKIKTQLENGEIDLIIGTHALISDSVKFFKLGLVVTDEQHRFGVAQRSKLVDKGENPHLLIMSATPIPRTLALIIYGDLDVSVIDTLPPGRQSIDTFLVDSGKRYRMYKFLKKHMDAGHQCYIVCPAVEENELNIASAQEYAEKISKEYFKDYSVGLVYGKMKALEKEQVMNAFSQGRISLLVSTTVIEVGVDVPNATVMVVENAERFGLSQLHQLRGRVGRGKEKSFCILMSDVQNEEALERLRTMCHTNNGFEIADADLRLRGPGDFFGARQHGLPQMKIAPLTDMDFLTKAQQCAAEIMKDNTALSEKKYKGLYAQVKMLFSKMGENSFN
ncbi:MAG TPA: ATP-dependent DNA helicase RecG [Clostridiales bacterium]|nr:ATP-dependent DNA helicase RecG [Clostridiales bacterium]